MSPRSKLVVVLFSLACGWATVGTAQEEPPTPEPVVPTEDSLVGRWVVSDVNGDAVQPDMVMVLELTDEGESFMEVGDTREPSGDWDFDREGTTYHLTQTTPDGATVANQITMSSPDQFTLSSPDGFTLSFFREGTTPAESAPAAEQRPVDSPELAGTWVTGQSPTGGDALDVGTVYAMQPDGTLSITREGETRSGQWRAYSEQGIAYVELAPSGAEPMQLAYVLTPEGDVMLMAPDGMIYPLGRSQTAAD